MSPYYNNANNAITSIVWKNHSPVDCMNEFLHYGELNNDARGAALRNIHVAAHRPV